MKKLLLAFALLVATSANAQSLLQGGWVPTYTGTDPTVREPCRVPSFFIHTGAGTGLRLYACEGTFPSTTFVRQGDGAGGGSPGGATTQVQFNNAGAFGGDAGMTYDLGTDILTTVGGFQVTGGCLLTTALSCPAQASVGGLLLLKERTGFGLDTWSLDLAAVNLTAPFSISPEPSGLLRATQLLHVTATDKILCRDTAAAGAVEECSVSAALSMIGATQGNILYYDGANWVVLAPGTAGHFLQTQGVGSNPLWAAASGGGGSSIILDFLDDGANESAGILEISTFGADPGGVFSEPSADELRINVQGIWPQAAALRRVGAPASGNIVCTGTGCQFDADEDGISDMNLEPVLFQVQYGPSIYGSIYEGAPNAFEMAFEVDEPISDIIYRWSASLGAGTYYVATLSGAETLLNKTLNAANNVIHADDSIALAANGSNCATSGQVAAGVDASGVAEGCRSFPQYVRRVAAGCNVTSAGPAINIPSANGATANCYGTDPWRFGGLGFADGSLLNANFMFDLKDWDAGAISLDLIWMCVDGAGACSSNSVVWEIRTKCVGVGVTYTNPTFNAVEQITTAASATDESKLSSSDSSLDVSGCAAGSSFLVEIFRDPTEGSDTLTGTAVLLEAIVKFGAN
jgi:hypothetical protein